MNLRLFSLSAVFLTMLIPPAALAQRMPTTTGFALDHFEPSDRGSDWFGLDSLDLRGNDRPAAGLIFDWANNPLVLRNLPGQTKPVNLVANQVFVHPGASLILFDRLRIALNLPIAVY